METTKVKTLTNDSEKDRLGEEEGVDEDCCLVSTPGHGMAGLSWAYSSSHSLSSWPCCDLYVSKQVTIYGKKWLATNV